jgi:hypothetical protein
MISNAAARKILLTYGKAWTTRKTSLILSIFTSDATYQETWYKRIYKGHSQIAKYWDETVVEGQSKIRYKVLDCWLTNDGFVGAWEAWFYYKAKKANRHIRGVGIFKMKGSKVKSLREIWQKKV